jgi:hypothetical protein
MGSALEKLKGKRMESQEPFHDFGMLVSAIFEDVAAE